MPKIVFWPHCNLALRSRSKVGVKVKGRSQGHRSESRSQVRGQGEMYGVQRSILGAQLCRVQQRATVRSSCFTRRSLKLCYCGKTIPASK